MRELNKENFAVHQHLKYVEVFSDLTLWIGIKWIIDRINANAVAA